MTTVAAAAAPRLLLSRLQSAGGGGCCCCFPGRPRHMGLARPAGASCRSLPAPAASRRAPLPVPSDQSLCPCCCLSAACRAPAAALCVCAEAAQPPMRVAALRCGTALSTFCEYPAEEPDALASPRPEAPTETPEPPRDQSRGRYGNARNGS